MSRLIKADDMIKSLMDMTFYDDEGHTIHDFEERLAIVKSFVDSVPTVEAQSVRHGRWRHYEGTLTCSECGTMFYDDIMEYCGDTVPRYCPECGADMRGEKE